MKKISSLILATIMVITFGFFALGSGESEPSIDDQGSGKVDVTDNDTNLGVYKVEIMGCRLAPAAGFQDKDVVIIKYKFTNNGDESASFMFAFDENVYQNGVGLNNCYFVDDSANYDSSNQTKEIKNGASLEVEVAYELNDTTTEIEVEVEELFDFSDNMVKKTFSIS